MFSFTALAILATLAVVVHGQEERDPEVYCKQCWKNRNQKDYYANEFDCTTYYHCFKNGSKIEGILRHCAAGLRFDEHILACVPMVYPDTDRKCEDPCSTTEMMMKGFWLKPNECGIFYQCTNYYSRKMCCPPNHRFNESWADCMFDKTCNHHNEECGTTGMTIPMLAPTIIDAETCFDVQYEVTRKVHADPSRYWVVLDIATTDTAEMIKNVSMPCPLGTHFDLNTCKCSIHANVTVGPSFEDCFLDLGVNAKGKIADSSYMKFWVDNAAKPKVEVETNEGSGSNEVIFCPGNGHLEIPGMQGMTLGMHVTIMSWINAPCGPEITIPAVVMSNRGEQDVVRSTAVAPTVLVTRVSETAIEFMIRTVKESITVTATIQCGVWQHLAFVYDGKNVIAYTNANEQQVVPAKLPDEQVFWMAHCPLNVCADPINGDTFFTGHLNSVRFCREAFSVAQIGASM